MAKTFTRDMAKEILEKQILQDAQEGDTTVLAEIISNMSDDEIWGSLSDSNQQHIKSLAK